MVCGPVSRSNGRAGSALTSTYTAGQCFWLTGTAYLLFDLVGQEDKEKARKILLRGVEQTPKKLQPATFPSPLISSQPSPVNTSLQARFGAPFPPYWNVSRRHAPYFTGHEEQIEQIFRAFTTRDAAQIPDPQAIVGLGGLGKTQTAAEYAYRFRTQYQAVLWVRADKRKFLADFRALVRLLELSEPENPIETMHTWFKEKSDWLLVLDNADDLQIVDAFLPRTQRATRSF